MTYSLGTGPSTSPPATERTAQWYKLSAPIAAWLRATHPHDFWVDARIADMRDGLVYIGMAPGTFFHRTRSGSSSVGGGDYQPMPGGDIKSIPYEHVMQALASPASDGPTSKPGAFGKLPLYIGLTALGTVAAIGAGLLLFRKKPAPAPASLASNRRRTSLRRNSGQRAAQNEAQIKYLLGEDIGRAGLAEEDEAAVESRLFVLGQQMSEAKSRLRRFGVRAIGNAQHLVDEFEQRGGWGSDPRGVLFTVADEFCGSGIPQEFLEEEFGWSQLDPETRAALQAMIEIAGIDAQGYRLAEDATSANADADEAERIAEVLSQGPLVSSVGEAYEDSVWNRLQEATGRASSAKYHRGSVLEQLGERIEANGRVVYAIPERRAYPITTAKDAVNATHRLKQGRVKSAAEARRIIKAIKKRHPAVWAWHLGHYRVSTMMAAKRQGLAARRRRTSRRMRSNPGEFAVGDRVVISDTPGRVGVVKGPPVLDKFFGVRFVPVLFEDVANPTKQLEDRLQPAPIVKVPPRPSIEWRVARARDELPSLYAMGWVDAADGIAPMWGSALAKSGDGLTSGADAYRQGYQHIEVRSIR